MVDNMPKIESSPARLQHVKKKIYKALILFIAFSGLYWLFKHIGWQTVADHMARLGWQGFALLFILGFLESIMDAGALKSAMNNTIGLFRCLAINNTGALVNTLIPLEAGEVIKGGLLSRYAPVRSAISGILIWNYVFKLTKPATAVSAALIALFWGKITPRPLILVTLGAAFLAFLPFVIYRMIIRLGPAAFLAKLSAKLRIKPSRSSDYWISDARKIDSTVHLFWKKHPHSYIKICVYQFSARLMEWFSIYVALRFMHPMSTYSLSFCGMIYAGFSVLSYLILLLPTSIGATEGGGYVLFFLYGLNPNLGLIVRFSIRIMGIITNVIPPLSLLFEKKSKEKPERA